MAQKCVKVSLLSWPFSHSALFFSPSCFRTFCSVPSSDTAKLFLSNGLPRFEIPLPSRGEICVFTMRPLTNTVGDLTKAILDEDKGVDRVAFLSNNGLRFAKANSIELLMSTGFEIVINDKKYKIDVSELDQPDSAHPNDINKIRALIGQLNCTLNADDIHTERENELRKRIDDITLQLEPLEQQRYQLASVAAERTRRLTWIGLAAMGLQFGLLARLTWWEYSWDIMEPVTYFVGYGTTMAMYAYYVVTRQDYSFPQVFDREYLKTFYQKAGKNGFDVEHYNQLSDKLAELRSDLRRLRDPLHLKLPLQQTGLLVKEDVEDSLNLRQLVSSDTRPS